MVMMTSGKTFDGHADSNERESHVRWNWAAVHSTSSQPVPQGVHVVLAVSQSLKVSM